MEIYPTFPVKETKSKVAIIRIGSDATFDFQTYELDNRSPQSIAWANQSGCRCHLRFCGLKVVHVQNVPPDSITLITYFVFAGFRYGGEWPHKVASPDTRIHKELLKVAVDSLTKVHRVKFTEAVDNALREAYK